MPTDPLAPDLYRRLGLPRRATGEQIRRAFRRLALRWHPDRNHASGATEAFIRLREAHDVLADPTRRAEYDRTVVFAPVAAPRGAPARRGAPQPPLFGGGQVTQGPDGRISVTAVLFGIPIRLEFGGITQRRQRPPR